MKSFALRYLLGLIACVICHSFCASAQTPQTSFPQTQGPAATLPTISLGSDAAPFTIEMYYSLSCTHCKNFEENELPKIKTRFIDTGEVRFILHDFPIDSLGLQAAKIIRCAPKGQYLSLMGLIFKDQDEWLLEKGGEEALREVALKAGVSPEHYEECHKNKPLENAILAGCLHARKTYKLDYAPAFVINGKLFEGEMTEHSLEKFLSNAVPDTTKK